MKIFKSIVATTATSLLLVAGVLVSAASQPPTANAAAAPAPTSVRAAFYYPWFPETNNWATHYTPVLGKYDSGSSTVLAAHVSMAKYAGLDAFISSWGGQGTPTATRLALLLDASRAQGFHVAANYVPESRSTPPTAAALTSDFNALFSQAANDSAWLRVGDKPVLFIYNVGVEASCNAIDRVKTASAGRFYLNMKVFTGYANCASQPDSWHQYGPAAAYDQQGTYSTSVSPGYYKFNESSPRLVRDLPVFGANLAKQVSSGSQWQLITTFNDWGAGSSVEPAMDWQSGSGNGDYLDAMRAAYVGNAPTPTTSPTATPTTTAPTTTAPTTTAPTTTAPTTTAPTTTAPTTTAPTTTAPTTTAPPTTSSAPTASGSVDKVLVFIEENHSLSQMQAGMPYLYSQATKFGYATHYTAITHPSLPNYLAIAFGSTFGISDDNSPASHPEASPDVFSAAINAGRTAKSYQESMPTRCATSSSSPYAVKHNPWAYDTTPSARTQCNSFDVPSGTTTAGALHDDLAAGTLPNVGEVTPNLNNDAHDGTLATADTWMKNWFTQIYASPDWKSGHLAVIVTADEDASNQGNTVLTTVIHPSQNAHVVTTPLTHYSMTTLLSEVGHSACMRNGCAAANFAGAFGLTIS